MTGIERIVSVLAAGIVLVCCCGCDRVPGIPSAGADVPRPDMQVNFQTLYKENCSGCHGANGRSGAAIALNNPALLAVTGPDNLRTTVSRGLPGTLMPAFAASSGGMLTDRQVDALVQGIEHEWSRPADFAGVALPAFADTAQGNVANGQAAYTAACARCHGADGTGVHAAAGRANTAGVSSHSIVDTSYLTLVNDQSLRGIVIAGHLDWNALDWRSYISGRALTPEEITDIVAWVASHRAAGAQAIVNPHTNSPGVAKDKP